MAALQCHEASAYNRFVIAYRPELQDSDAALKAFFVRRGGEHGEAGYDTFKTKAANLSALEQARDARAFCADAHALFEAALANRGSLMSFVQTRSGDTGLGSVCVESRPAPLAVRTAEARPVEVAPGPVAAASVKIPTAPARAASHQGCRCASCRQAVGGVPAYSARHALRPPRRAPPPAMNRNADRDARDQDEEDQVQPAYATEQDEAPPPPRPRYYQIRDRAYATTITTTMPRRRPAPIPMARRPAGAITATIPRRSRSPAMAGTRSKAAITTGKPRTRNICNLASP